jgi:hypothetical protein
MSELTLVQLIERIKETLKVKNTWHFISVRVGVNAGNFDNVVYLKLWRGEKETIVERFLINGIYHSLSFNYGTKKATELALIEHLQNTIK